MSLGCPTCLIRVWAHSSVGSIEWGRVGRRQKLCETCETLCHGSFGPMRPIAAWASPGRFRTAHSWSKALLRMRLAGGIRGVEPYRHRVCEVCLSCQSSIGREAGLAAH